MSIVDMRWNTKNTNIKILKIFVSFQKFRIGVTEKQKVGKRYHANTMLKKTVEALLISEWIDFKMIKR